VRKAARKPQIWKGVNKKVQQKVPKSNEEVSPEESGKKCKSLTPPEKEREFGGLRHLLQTNEEEVWGRGKEAWERNVALPNIILQTR